MAELKDLVLRQDNSTIIAAYSWYLDHVANHFARMQLAGNIEAKILVELKTLIESIVGQQNNIFHLLIRNLFENNQSLSSPAARDEENPTVAPEFSSAIEERVQTAVGLLDSLYILNLDKWMKEVMAHCKKTRPLGGGLTSLAPQALRMHLNQCATIQDP